MTISQMRYFLAVCEHENVTKAAQAMHISQPSVSASIRELESEFGVDLFHRIKRRLVLTQEGYLFRERAIRILEQVDAAAAQMQDLGRGRNKISIGVPPMIGTFLFPSIFQSFHETYPEIEIVLAEHGSLKVRELVMNGQLDIAIAITNPGETAEFEMVHILKTSLLFCVAPSHHMASRREVSLEELRSEPIILLSDGSFQNRELLSRFANKNIKPKIQLTSGQLYTIKKLIGQGKAGAFLFEEIAAIEPDLIGIPLAEPIALDICLIWRKGQHMFSDAAKLIRFVTEAIGG